MLLAFGTTHATAQDATPLTNYVDANGFLDVQTLTCAQLADTYQQDADALTSWYSGWYNGLAKKQFYDPKRSKEVEHEVILYCKTLETREFSRQLPLPSRTNVPNLASG